MLHVGPLHQAPEVKAFSGGGGDVGGRLGGEVGVDEGGEVGLVGEQRGPRGSRAPPHRGAVLLRQAVANQGAPSRLGGEEFRLCGGAQAVPAVPLLPAAAAAAPPQPEGRRDSPKRPRHKNPARADGARASPVVGDDSQTVASLGVPNPDLPGQAAARQQHPVTGQALDVLQDRGRLSEGGQGAHSEGRVWRALTMLWPLSSRGEISLTGGE